MVRRLWSSRALTAFALGFVALVWDAPAAHAQTEVAAQAPAHVSFVDGAVMLERDGTTDDSPGSMPLLAGDRLRTRNGRAEILFADGSTLHLDTNSAIDLQSDELVRLIEGRIRLSIPGPSRQVSYRIDAPHGWAHITEPGDYRVSLMQSVGGGELELAVIRGRAELANEGGQTPLRAGERAFVRAGAAPSDAYVANSSALEAFDRWSENRRDQRMAASAEYLPEDVRPYAASFEQYGYWSDEPTYGRVWYPRVALDWRPYYRGRWASLRPYGWTWVSYDPWGWPTHHYGRWGLSSAGAWFWIPGRTWGAAWVSWAFAPGYVSWCPLGWNNRPIFQINVFNVRGYNPWRAWTVVPHNRFGHGFVHTYAVRANHIDGRTLSAFAYRDRGPEVRDYRGGRAAAPIRVAGTRPRLGPAPLYTNVPADRARINTDGARVDVPNGARPSPSGRSASPLPMQRAVPSRPAVRSDRGTPQDRSGSPVTRQTDERRDAEPAIRTAPSSGARSRIERSDETPRSRIREYDRSGREIPRSEPSAPDGRRPSTSSAPDVRATPGARQRWIRPASPAIEAPAPRRMEAPSYERPSSERPSTVQPSPSYGGRPAPSYEPRPRAVPRAEPSRPTTDPRPPQVERRGGGGSPAARPSGGAPPSSAQPGGGRSSGPPPGARPRGGGRGGHSE